MIISARLLAVVLLWLYSFMIWLFCPVWSTWSTSFNHFKIAFRAYLLSSKLKKISDQFVSLFRIIVQSCNCFCLFFFYLNIDHHMVSFSHVRLKSLFACSSTEKSVVLLKCYKYLTMTPTMHRRQYITITRMLLANPLQTIAHERNN